MSNYHKIKNPQLRNHLKAHNIQVTTEYDGDPLSDLDAVNAWLTNYCEVEFLSCEQTWQTTETLNPVSNNDYQWRLKQY